MKTITMKIDQEEIDLDKIRTASEIIKNGGLVAFPTETVYGLGADALDSRASAKIYEAKGRPSDNPLIIHIFETATLDEIALDISEKARKLMKKFWPGPLTLIFNKAEKVPYQTTGGLETVAVRMPSNPIALALIRESGTCIAAPSANTSGKPSPTKAVHVQEDLNGRIDLIIDGGDVGLGLESTILDMTGADPVILRPGFITKEMIEELIGKVEVDDPDKSAGNVLKPKAPGMKYRHYAPKAELILVRGEQGRVVDKINRLVNEAEKKGIKAGIAATDETKDKYQGRTVLSLGSRADVRTIAKNLYSVLRQFDEMETERIYCEAIEGEHLGKAVMNRLKKAASNKVIQADGERETEERI